MPRSLAGDDQYAGISKDSRVMRKGTKSCLPCRRRKIRCSGTDSSQTQCVECKSRGDTCVAQGILADDDAVTNRRLKERISLLESRLRAAGITTESLSEHQNGAAGALRNLLADVDQDGATEGLRSAHHVNRGEEEVETSQAPLMRLLNNNVFGATPESSSTTPNSNNQLHQGQAGPLRPGQHSAKDREVLRDLCSYLPSEAVMSDILDQDSSWWPLYRETLGFHWGGDLPDLRSFAKQALTERIPSEVGLLLVSFAIGTGELDRYLPPVERRIMHDDHYAATEYGLNCLMALGLCYMNSLQPRRAWTVYRRANTLLQLNGIHLQHRSERHELLFWQLFHADRWVSLMIGLPYMAPDNLCQLTIAPIGVLGAGTWLYRQFGIITGRVIDCIQNIKGPTLATALEVEEQLENVRSQLPPGYMDLALIRATSDATDRYTRLYRVVHYHLLKSTVHLPFLLRSANENRFEFSRKSCIDDSRRLLEAFLEIFDGDPNMVCYGTVISFTAFTAAVVVILGLFGYGLPQRPEYITSQSQRDHDWKIILRVREAIKYGASSKVAGLLCSKCHVAIESMMSCADNPGQESTRRIVLPYFGTLVFTQSRSPAGAQYRPSAPQRYVSDLGGKQAGMTQTAAYDTTAGVGFGGGVSMTYDGPYLPENDSTSWMLGLESQWLPPDAGEQQAWGAGAGGGGGGPSAGEADWGWLYADLPPSTGL